MKKRRLNEKTMLLVENEEDLILLTQIIKEGDVLEFSTTRVYRVGRKEERKKVRLILKVEKIKEAQGLKILGVILDGWPEEYVPRGKHHSVDVVPPFVIYLHRPLSAMENQMIERSHSWDIWVILVDDSDFFVWHKGDTWDGTFRYGDQYDWGFLDRIPPGAEVVVGGVPPWRDRAAAMLRKRNIKVYPVSAMSVEEAFRKLDLNGVREKEEMELYERLSSLMAKGEVGVARDVEEWAEEHRIEYLVVTPEFFKENRRLCERAVEGGARLTVARIYEPLILLLRSLRGAAAIKRW